jgi:hypothetical protein
MLATAAAQLSAGRGVILDATFQLRMGRDEARALAAAHHVPFLLVECRCDEDEVRRRLADRGARGDSPSDADWHVYLEQRRHFEPVADDERSSHLALDTTKPLTAGTMTIEEALRRRTC